MFAVFLPHLTVWRSFLTDWTLIKPVVVAWAEELFSPSLQNKSFSLEQSRDPPVVSSETLSVCVTCKASSRALTVPA